MRVVTGDGLEEWEPAGLEAALIDLARTRDGSVILVAESPRDDKVLSAFSELASVLTEEGRTTIGWMTAEQYFQVPPGLRDAVLPMIRIAALIDTTHYSPSDWGVLASRIERTVEEIRKECKRAVSGVRRWRKYQRRESSRPGG